MDSYELESFLPGRSIAFVIGILLLITAFLQLRAGRGGNKMPKDLNRADGVILGVMQGLALLPGLSRSAA